MPSGQKPKVYPQEVIAHVAALYGAGKTQHEVAEEVGLSQKVVWNLMRRHGLRARPAIKRNQTGEANSSWKGDDAGKQAFHRRLYARFGKPTKCSVCHTTASQHYDYANLTGHYENINDYAPMCRSCHWKYDEKHKNFTSNKGGVSCSKS